MAVYLIADILAGFDFQLLGKRLLTVGELGCIDYFVFTPAAFLKHWSTLQVVSVGLDVFALILVGNLNIANNIAGIYAATYILLQQFVSL